MGSRKEASAAFCPDQWEEKGMDARHLGTSRTLFLNNYLFNPHEALCITISAGIILHFNR